MRQDRFKEGLDTNCKGETMTVEDAKEILSKNWWKNLNPSFKHERHEIILGELVRETNDDDECFPNSYIIRAAIIKKGEQPPKDNDDDDEFGAWDDYMVSKIDGECRPATVLF